MKKVLVTGAAGTVGIKTIKYLLSEGKYDITALDIKNRKSYRRLKPYRKRIDIVFDDATNKDIIDSLVKDSDIVIHLVGNLPFLANVNEDLMRNNEYKSVKVVVDSIRKYNPDCYLLYTSTTSVYEDSKVDKKVTSDVKGNCFYSKYKIKCEKYIAKHLKNYTVGRLSYILGDIRKDNNIYNVALDTNLEAITIDNVAYALTAILDNKKHLNKKIINITGGKEYRVVYKDYLLQVLKNYGLTWSIFFSLILADKTYVGGYYKDEGVEKLLQFRTGDINNYFRTLKKYKKDVKRFVPRLLALPIIGIIKLKNK